MDAVILITAAGLTAYIPSQYLPYDKTPLLSGIASLGLTLCLFGLSVIEVTPSSWLVFVDNERIVGNEIIDTTEGSDRRQHNSATIADELNDDDQEQKRQLTFQTAIATFRRLFSSNGRLPLTTAYLIVLWGMSLLVTIIIPAIIGVHFLKRNCPTESSSTSTTPLVSPVVSPTSDSPMSTIDIGKAKKFNYKSAPSVSSKMYRFLGCIPQFILTIACRICGKFIDRTTTSFRTASSSKVTIATTPVVPEATNNPYNSAVCAFSQTVYCYVRRRWKILIGASVGISLSLCLFSFLSPFIIDVSYHSKFWDSFLVICLTTAVSWLTAVGVGLATLMNGFGCVAMPYSCLAGLFLHPFSAEAIKEAELEREKLLNYIDSRRRGANSISIQELSFSSQPSFSRTNSNVNGSPPQLHSSRSFVELGEAITSRRNSLLAEVEFMETLLDDVSDDIEEMKESFTMATKSRTTMGTLRHYLGITFSLILLVRLGSSALVVFNESVLLRPGSYLDLRSPSQRDVDIVTRVLLFMIGHNVVKYNNLETLTQFISLVLAAYFSFSQMNTFVRISAAINRRIRCNSANRQSTLLISRSLSGSNFLYFHLVAALLSCYGLACVVMTKFMLPYRFRAAFSSSLSGDFEINSPSDSNYDDEHMFRIRLFPINLLFIISAVLSTACLTIAVGIQRQNTYRYLAGNGINKPTEHWTLIDGMENLDP